VFGGVKVESDIGLHTWGLNTLRDGLAAARSAEDFFLSDHVINSDLEDLKGRRGYRARAGRGGAPGVSRGRVPTCRQTSLLGGLGKGRTYAPLTSGAAYRKTSRGPRAGQVTCRRRGRPRRPLGCVPTRPRETEHCRFSFQLPGPLLNRIIPKYIADDFTLWFDASSTKNYTVQYTAGKIGMGLMKRIACKIYDFCSLKTI
jgi:hypothetical protein